MRHIIRWGINILIWIMSHFHIGIDRLSARVRWGNLAMWKKWTVRSLKWLKKFNGQLIL